MTNWRCLPPPPAPAPLALPQDIAHKRGGSPFFTTPEVLVAGEPAVLYVNRRRLGQGLSDDPNLKVHFGFNSWAVGGQEQCLKPTSLWRGHDIDWCVCACACVWGGVRVRVCVCVCGTERFGARMRPRGGDVRGVCRMACGMGAWDGSA